MLEHIGLFHNIYFAYFEDSDLNFRAQLFGYDCIYEPDSISYHHGSGTGVKNSEFYVEKGRRNIEYFYFINMQGYLIYKYFLFHFIYEFINFLYFISIGRGLSFLKGKLEFLFNLKKVLNIRSDIKKKLKSEGKWNNLKEVELKFKKMGLVKSKFKKALNSYRKKIFK
jgi:GT2 family glycosyltransferase